MRWLVRGVGLLEYAGLAFKSPRPLPTPGFSFGGHTFAITVAATRLQIAATASLDAALLGLKFRKKRSAISSARPHRVSS